MPIIKEVTVITGGTSGVGRATARHFAKAGPCRIALLSRGEERLAATRKELEDRGAEVLTIPTDVADAGQVENAARQVEEVWGGIDVWINNAMTSVFSFSWDMEPEEFLRVTQVTYLGYVYGTLSALRRMRPVNRGKIVQVGSALAYRGIPLQSAYCAAKHAIVGFTESLQTELMHEKSRIQLSMVHLPAVNTPQFNWVKSRMPRESQPVPPIYQPEVPAQAIHWASHHRRFEMLVGASTYMAVIGNKISPALAARYLARTGVSSQMTEAPQKDGSPENLWQPAPGDFGCHGDFDAQSRRSSPLLWVSMHRRQLSMALAGGLLGVWAALKARMATG